MKNQENIWNYNMDECPLDTKVCLLSDNDCFLLPQQEFEGTLTFNGKFITRGECYKGDADYFYRSKIIAWKFIGDIMPTIKENDLLEYDGKFRNVFQCTKEMAKSIRALEKYEGRLIVEYENCDDFYYNWVNSIEDVLKYDDIAAIYRKQGKDYICIWEK